MHPVCQFLMIVNLIVLEIINGWVFFIRQESRHIYVWLFQLDPSLAMPVKLGNGGWKTHSKTEERRSLYMVPRPEIKKKAA